MWVGARHGGRGPGDAPECEAVRQKADDPVNGSSQSPARRRLSSGCGQRVGPHVGQASDVLADIHPLVQNPDNQDALRRRSIEDDVALVREAPVARPNVLRAGAHARILA